MEKLIEPTIIDQTKDYLVINKPAGLLVHDDGKKINQGEAKEKTLVDWLKKKYPTIKKVGEDVTRPGIVHRLDKDVSGLMVIAKNQKSFNYFKDLFQTRQLLKEYTALVYGKIHAEEGKIDFALKRSAEGFKMAAVPNNFLEAEAKSQHKRQKYYAEMGDEEDTYTKNPKEIKIRAAETDFLVTKRFINYTLLELRIKTGRTHQIRVHLSAYGHPLVGDDLYGTKKTRVKNQKNKLGRIFLTATHLEFVDPQGEEKKYKIELPTELKNFLAKAK